MLVQAIRASILLLSVLDSPAATPAPDKDLRGSHPGERALCTDCGKQCVVSTIPVPIVGECLDIFTTPQQLRTCVSNQSSGDARVQPVLVKISAPDLSVYSSISVAFTNQQCRLRWQDWIQPPSFLYNCYGGEYDMTPCYGIDDYFTCVLGTCVRLVDRPNWPVDWWQIVSPNQFGGIPATRYDVRQWYCSPSPGFPIGIIRIGNLGSQVYYAPSSNPWILSECDVTDSLGNLRPDPNVDCKDVEEETPVTYQCCGFCILSQAHLMRLWNCTVLSDPINNAIAVQALALYCRQTQRCSETRPCLGDPLKMGDASSLFDPSTYTIGCDQLDSGCASNGQCKYRWACDNRIEALRQRTGYYTPSGSPQHSPLQIIWITCIILGLQRLL